MMDMRQLKYFVQIVESGSLAKASRQLFIAQPALSQQMARLEAEVGKPLLVRSSRGVIATENGAALYHHARFMLRQMEQALVVARQESAAVSGRVTLGLAPTTVCRLGLPLLLHLREKYPRVILNIVEGLSGNLEHMTRLGQFDLAVLFSQSAATDLRVEPLLEEELFVILPASSKLVPREKVSLTLSEISKLPLLLPSPNHGLRRRIALEFERTNTPLEAVAEIDSLPLLMSCVARGMGATIKPQVAVQALGDAPLRWRCLRISDAHMTRTSYLYSLPAEQLSSCASAVHAELRLLERGLVESGEWTGVTLPPCAPEDLNLDSEVSLAALAG